MSADFKFDQRAIDKFAQDAANEVKRKAQPEFDRLCRECSGRPGPEVKPKVEALLRRLGWEAERGDVDAYAEAIARGDRIVLR